MSGLAERPPRRPHRRWPSRIKHEVHDWLWRVVEGAVVDACKAHPEYLTDAGKDRIVGSVTKRVVGSIGSALVADGRTVRAVRLHRGATRHQG